MGDWLKIAIQKDVVIRSIKVGLLVGSMLVAINQGDRIFAGEWSAEILLKICMTYMVPYCVSTYACVAAIRAERSSQV